MALTQSRWTTSTQHPFITSARGRNSLMNATFDSLSKLVKRSIDM